jgi:hypothetical protein
MKTFAPLALALLASFHAGAAAAAEPIATDRPDFVESSQAVLPRQVQLETSVAWERNDGDTGSATPTLLRIGLAPDWELRLESDGWLDARDGRGGAFGDVALGVKHHLAASPAGASLAWLVHVDLPSGRGEPVGRGLRPSLRGVAEWELDGGRGIGVMPGVAMERDASGHSDAAGLFGIVLGQTFGSASRGFVELSLPRIPLDGGGGTEATFDIGATHRLNDDLQLDVAYSRGLTDATADHALTFGLSKRW